MDNANVERNVTFIHEGAKYTREEFKELCENQFKDTNFLPTLKIEEVPLSEDEKKEFEEEWSKLNWGKFNRVILGEPWTEKATEKKVVKRSAVGITEGIMNQSVYYAPVGEKESETIKQWEDRLKFSEVELEYQKALLKNNRALLKIKDREILDLERWIRICDSVYTILSAPKMSDLEKIITVKAMMKKRATISREMMDRDE